MGPTRKLEHDWLDRPLPSNVVIDEGAWLYSTFAFLHYASDAPVGVRIGAHSGIYSGSFFELGPHGQVDIGRYCSVVGAIVVSNGPVVIGDYTFIAHEVVIADDPWARPPDRAAIRVARGPHLGSDVWVGMGAVIIGDLTIGDGSIVAARAVVTEDVPPGTVVAGNPARIVRRHGPASP